mgnify:CR=1 FL=1
MDNAEKNKELENKIVKLENKIANLENELHSTKELLKKFTAPAIINTHLSFLDDPVCADVFIFIGN